MRATFWLRLCISLLILLTFPTLSLAQCTATEKNKGAGALATTGNPTDAATINALGQLVTGTVWCLPATTCTATVKVGTQTATVIATAIANGNTSTGMGYIWYILSTTVSGAQTITGTITGTHTNAQIGYIDFAMSAGCTATLDVTSSLGTSTNNPMTVPSITTTAGDVVYIFSDTAGTGSTYGTPWTTGTVWATSSNADAYILSASGSAQANNWSATGGVNNASLATSFKMASSTGTVDEDFWPNASHSSTSDFIVTIWGFVYGTLLGFAVYRKRREAWTCTMELVPTFYSHSPSRSDHGSDSPGSPGSIP